MNVAGQDLASPFSFATVVVADDYVDTFPHPQGFITYLHRLCLQLDVDIVSLERPVTVKGSWKTIIKIDAFLKTLISTLQSAISKGAVPSEADFSAAFTHFEEENNYRTEPLDGKQGKSKFRSDDIEIQEQAEVPQELDELTVTPADSQSQSPEDVSKAAADDTDPNTHDKWYFNANPRGKTAKKRKCSKSGMAPPEPLIILEADDTNKVNQPNLTEIEKVLSEVYRKETIEKYQKKPCNNDRPTQEINSSIKETLVIKQEISSDNEVIEIVRKSESSVLSNTAKRCDETLVASDSDLAKPKDSSDIVNTDEHPEKNPSQRRKRDRSKRMSLELTENTHSKLAGRRQSMRQRKHKEEKRINAVDHNQTEHKRKTSEKPERCKKTPDAKVKIKNRHKQDVQTASIKPLKGKGKSEKETDSNSGNSVNKNKRESVVRTNIKYRSNDKKMKLTEMKSNHKREGPGAQYNCDQCSYVTTKRMQLVEHKRRVHLTTKFKCPECLKEFGFQKDLRRHMKCHSKAENCCDVCGKMYKEVRKLTEHKKIHADDYVKPTFPCKFCNKSFSTKYVLAYHLKSEHLGMKRSYICPTCGKSFSQKNSYLQHANVHLGIKPFTCEICGKTFSYEKSLKEHKFMHNEHKVFSCNICNKSFRQASGLTTHLKVHKATKDYVCSMCGKGFSQRQALVRHERIHAGEKPYECGICKRTFGDPSVLRRHMILIHNKDPKQWRQDTLCHIAKRTDFYIKVINGNDSNSDNAEPEKTDKSRPQNQQKQQQQLQEQNCERHEQQSSHHEQQNIQEHGMLQQGHEDQHAQHLPDTVSSVIVTAEQANPDSDSSSLVKEESNFLDLKEPATIVVGNYSSAPFVDIKPYSSYNVSERNLMTDNIDSPIITANANQHVDTSLFSSPPLHIQTSSPLQMQNSVSVQTHCMESVTDQIPASLSAQIAPPLSSLPASNTASFVPITYQQRQFTYDANNLQPVEIQQVQYSTMMSQQYTPTIVVLQDSMGAITYHQSGVNVAFSSDVTPQNVQFQHLSQNPAVSLPSPPLPHVADISQSVTSLTPRYANHQQPQ